VEHHITAFVWLAVDATGVAGLAGEMTGTAHIDPIVLHPRAIDDRRILVKVRPAP
jgi:hypothetical protein